MRERIDFTKVKECEIMPLKTEHKTNGRTYVTTVSSLCPLKGKGKAMLQGVLEGITLGHEPVILRLQKLRGYRANKPELEQYKYFWVYPSNNDFGQYGWSYPAHLEKEAQKRYEEIIL